MHVSWLLPQTDLVASTHRPPMVVPCRFKYRTSEGTVRDALVVLFIAGSTYYGVTARDFILSVFLVVYAYTLIWVPERKYPRWIWSAQRCDQRDSLLLSLLPRSSALLLSLSPLGRCIVASSSSTLLTLSRPTGVYASTAALIRGKPGEGYEWRWYPALSFRMLVPFFGQYLIELICSDLTCASNPDRPVTGCTYLDSTLFAACLGIRVAYYLVVEMLEINGERLDGVHEQSTLAHLDEVSNTTLRLEEQQAVLVRDLDRLTRLIQRNERVLARYANDHGEKLDSLKEFEERMNPITTMLREAEEEVQAETILGQGVRALLAPANMLLSIALNPLGFLFPNKLGNGYR
eukprot:m.115136 g.115136  ORF g.115136 m.115136 type:complete len:348 (+) comp13078_c0_seq2:31-1074(+)